MKNIYKPLIFIFLVAAMGVMAMAVFLLTKGEVVWFILCFIPFSLSLILVWVFFAKLTNRYPLNSSQDYLYDPKKSQLGYKENGIYEIEIQENNKGIWEIKNDEEHLIFDMRGYFFPKTYICTFFIRNLHYPVLNKNKYKLHRLFTSLNLDPLKKFQKMSLIFCYKKKIKRKIIVKNGRTTVGFFRGMIIQTRFYFDTFGYRASNTRMRKNIVLSEKLYENETKNQSKPSLK